MEVNEIRENIESYFEEILESKENLKFKIKSGAYGHSAGDSIEEILKKNLLEQGWDAYYTHDFVSKVFSIIGPDKDELNSFLDNLWWSKIAIYSKNQLNNFIKGKDIGTYQQAGADIVLFYGEDLKKEPEKVILINAKSHNTDRKSRAPNIISAQRLLEFCSELITNEDMINNAEYWFVGINYSKLDENVAEIEEIYIKDLFKINVSKISQINFDAAIQIQSHVEDMEELEQTKIEFIKDISELFIVTWKNHVTKKTEKYENLIAKINNLLERYT